MKHKMFRKLAAVVLAAAFLMQLVPTVSYAAENPIGVFFANLFGAANSSAFTTLEIRETSATGAVVVNLLSPTAGWKLDAGTEYYLCGTAPRQQGVDSVQIRAGNADGSFNGLTFRNPPGGSYAPGAITHDYFDKISAYDAIPDPTYGIPVKTLELQDGTVTYHIKDTVDASNSVSFVMGLVLDATAHNGNTTLPNALEVAIGSVSGTSFTATSSKSTDVNVSPRGTLSASFNGLSPTAMLDAPGGWIYPRICNAPSPVTLLYDKLEYDLYYPKDAELTNIGFSATSNTEKNYGTLTSGNPVIEGNLKKTHVTIEGGYKPGNVNLQSCAQFTFSSDYFAPDQKCSITLQNIKITPKGGGDVISIADAKNAAVYTILDPKADYTLFSALNRPLVYNHTIDTSAPYMVTLGAAEILNKSTSATSPYSKTYEADFNTTNTAAVISVITVPLGTNSSPVVNWEGTAADGSKKSGTLANPGNYAQKKGNIAGSKFLQIKASDLGIKSFTSVQAEIGQIRANYNSSGSGSNWDITYNGSGAFGYFTTGESGIQVKNTYRLYNTDPAQRNIVGGNLTTTSTATSTVQDRMGFTSGDASIKNEAGAETNSIPAGETATISGYVFPYSVPEVTGKEGLAGNDALAVDPVIYLTLPAGLTYDTLNFTLAEQLFDGSNKNDQALSHFVENVSYLNTTNDGVSIYKITFPAGTTLGYYSGDGSRFTLYYTIKLRTSKSLETKNYELNKLMGVSTKNNVEALSISSNPDSINTVMPDTYGMNGGKNYAGITKKGSAATQPGFGVQQLSEVNVYNAVSVTKINGQATSGAWQTYDPSDPNSIASLGKNSEGEFRLNIQNTSASASGALELLLPIPKKGVDMGDVFTQGVSAFDMAVTIPTTELTAQSFSGKYVTVSGVHDVYDKKIAYTDSNAANANAILLTTAAIQPGANLFFQFPFTVTGGDAGATNIWRNAFQYAITETDTYYKTGSYVASAVAGSSITGVVFEDKNRNGLREAGEQGVPGVTVVVKDSEHKILSAVTDASGSYTFLAVRETPVTMSYTIPESQKLRFNIPKSTAANGSKVTPGTDGLSATHSFTATGNTETVNAAVSNFVTIGYDKNNAAATGDLPPTGECPSGSTVTVSVKPDNLLYTGYIFKEWNTAPDGKGTGYQPGQTLTVTDSMTLYAIWEIGTYTLRFDYRGATGGNTTTEKHLIHNQSYDTGGALPAPTRPGYTFKGWAVNAATTTVIAESALFTLGEDSTLYAVWTAKSGYTVKYHTNGTAIADRSVTWVEGVLPTDAPTRPGYTFNGWYYNGNKVTIAATYGALAGAETPSITLDAGWTAKTGYTVHYNSTGGTAVPDKTDVSWSDSGLLPQNNPTRTNFAFGGWKLTNTETLVTSATHYSELVNSDQITAITLDAVWNMLANNTVSYDTGGGTVYTDKTGVMSTDSGLIPTTPPVRAGYEFIGWMSGANTVTAATVYRDLTANTTLTLTANWKAKSYTISYSEGGFASISKGYSDSGLIGGKTPIKEGSTFDGWYYGSTKVTDATKVSGLIPQDNTTAITLTAKWNEDSYTIAYASSGGGSFPPKTGVKYSASNLLPDSAPVRLGYNFAGWKCGETAVTAETICGTLANQAASGVITLSASWTAKTGYTVRYNSTGGTAVPDKTGVSWTQTALTPAANPTRTGYEFKAWVSGRTTVTASTAYGAIAADDTAGSSVTLVAQWNEVAGYTVKFDTGAGTPVGDKTNLTLNSSNLLPLHDIAPAGYYLTGWTFKGMTVTQSTTYGELAAIAGGSPVVLTAVYAPITGGGNGTDVQGKVIEGTSGVYKLDVSWGAMKFDYNPAGAVWNPVTHSYEAGGGAKGWTNESFVAPNNKITVANHSNGDVLLSYLAKLEAALAGATMTVRSTNSLQGAEAKSLLLEKVPSETAPAPTVDAYVWLNGDPTNVAGLNGKTYTKAGVITITAEPDTAGGLTPKTNPTP